MKKRSRIWFYTLSEIGLFVMFFNISFRSIAQESSNSLIDTRDGKTYKTVTIGSIIWMAENLAFKTSGGCWAYDLDTSNVTAYGYLYTMGAANSGVCPKGWFVPTMDEWNTLVNSVGGELNSIGGYDSKLKEAGLTHWQSPNERSTNESGFTALPGGYKDYNNVFQGIGSYGSWWGGDLIATISQGKPAETHDYFFISNDKEGVFVGLGSDIKEGRSVRCVKKK